SVPLMARVPNTSSSSHWPEAISIFRVPPDASVKFPVTVMSPRPLSPPGFMVPPIITAEPLQRVAEVEALLHRCQGTLAVVFSPLLRDEHKTCCDDERAARLQFVYS